MNTDSMKKAIGKFISKGDSLLSTVVKLTGKGKLKIASLYGQCNVTTHYFFYASISMLLRLLDTRFNQRFYLTHLIAIPTSLTRFRAVFHGMAKPIKNYIMSKNLEFNQVDKFVTMQGFTPLYISNNRFKHLK